ncbi:hypothetical protein BaRGS_00038614 [Batillaria attramentaria]|uniref:C1q domain-containing protein n=1 Tax=Batillaria attramentaria TaxID=370345 RepID=A0ABD0J6R3_9CAEN
MDGAVCALLLLIFAAPADLLCIPPRTQDGSVQISHSGHAVKNTTGHWLFPLMCGRFLDLGSPSVTPYISTPTGDILTAKYYDRNGSFVFLLPTPVTTGFYACRLPDNVTSSCVPEDSPLLQPKFLHIDWIEFALILAQDTLSALKNEIESRLRSQAETAERHVEALQTNLTRAEAKQKTMREELQTKVAETREYAMNKTEETRRVVTTYCDGKTEDVKRNLHGNVTSLAAESTRKYDQLLAKYQGLADPKRVIRQVQQMEQKLSNMDNAVSNMTIATMQASNRTISSLYQSMREELDRSTQTLNARIASTQDSKVKNLNDHMELGLFRLDKKLRSVNNSIKASHKYSFYARRFGNKKSKMKNGQLIILSTVSLNEGGAFSNVTNTFTTVTPGLYVFMGSVTCEAKSVKTEFQINVAGQPFCVHNENELGLAMAHCQTIVHLVKGDVVHLKPERVLGDIWVGNAYLLGFLLRPDEN